MVKGLSRKIIIVKSPDPKIFEQAIFIVRDDYLVTQGVSQKELMQQARQAASGYLEQTYGWKHSKLIKGFLYGTGCIALIALLSATIYLFL